MKISNENRAKVIKLAGFGLSAEHIAHKLKITASTLKRDFKYELMAGVYEANLVVSAKLFEQATGDEANFNAQKFWLETRAGWISELDKLKLKTRTENAKARAVGKKDIQAEESKKAASKFKPTLAPVAFLKKN